MADLNEVNVATSIENEKPTKTLERKSKFAFNNGCFCIPHRTGCLILAYLFLLGYVASGVKTILSITSAVYYILQIGTDRFLTTVIVIGPITLVLDAITLTFHILLLIGLHQKRRSYVKMFVKFQLVNVIINVLIHIFQSFRYVMPYRFIAIGFTSDMLNIYYMFVMRIQYMRMSKAKLPRQVYRDGHVEIMP